MFRKTIRNVFSLSAATLISRFLGLIRDVIVARWFGTTGVIEAFIAAFRLPNVFRSIFAEGFADSVATPVLSEHQHDKQKIFQIGNNLILLFLFVLSIATIVGVISSKYLVMLIAPGFMLKPELFNLTVLFTRLMFSYLFFIGLSAISISILYSLKRFFIAAFTPALLNVVFIVGIVFWGHIFKDFILVICVIVAGIFQVVFPFIFLRREGFVVRFHFSEVFKDKEVIKMLKLFVPRIWASIIYHISVFVNTIFASFTSITGEGALAAVYFSDRLVQLPFALIALSISQVAMVDLSSYHKEDNLSDFKKLFVFAVQNIIFFIIPVVFIFMFLSEGIIDVLFRRGEFDASSLTQTSSVLFFSSLGILFFCGVRLLVNCFYALKDTRTPAKTATIALVVNVVLSFCFMFPLKIGGVALGGSFAAMFHFFFLYFLLVKKIGVIDWADTKLQCVKVVGIGLVAAFVARFVWDGFDYERYVRISLSIGAWGIVFIGGGSVLKLKQIHYAARKFRGIFVKNSEKEVNRK